MDINMDILPSYTELLASQKKARKPSRFTWLSKLCKVVFSGGTSRMRVFVRFIDGTEDIAILHYSGTLVSKSSANEIAYHIGEARGIPVTYVKVLSC